jgi:alpha/beta superfamily hydrolase
MDDPVVTTVASALVAGGCAVLRFNFGGVGASEGGWGGGPPEVEDAAGACDALVAAVRGVAAPA